VSKRKHCKKEVSSDTGRWAGWGGGGGGGGPLFRVTNNLDEKENSVSGKGRAALGETRVYKKNGRWWTKDDGLLHYEIH